MSTQPKGHDMSEHWRLVSVDNGPVTGVWWVSAPHKGDVSVRSVDVLIWVDDARSWAATFTTKDISATVKPSGAVRLPEHMVYGAHRELALDRIDDVKAAVLAATAAVSDVWGLTDSKVGA